MRVLVCPARCNGASSMRSTPAAGTACCTWARRSRAPTFTPRCRTGATSAGPSWARVCGALDPTDPASLVIPAPDPEELAACADTVPPMQGAELLTPAWLDDLWSDTGEALTAEVARYKGGVQGYLKTQSSVWNVVGRVCFHLAENTRDVDYPFASIATYVQDVSKQAKPQDAIRHQDLLAGAGGNAFGEGIRFTSPRRGVPRHTVDLLRGTTHPGQLNRSEFRLRDCWDTTARCVAKTPATDSVSVLPTDTLPPCPQRPPVQRTAPGSGSGRAVRFGCERRSQAEWPTTRAALAGPQRARSSHSRTAERPAHRRESHSLAGVGTSCACRR